LRYALPICASRPPASSLRHFSDSTIREPWVGTSSEMLRQPGADFCLDLIRGSVDLLDLKTIHEQPGGATEKFERPKAGCVRPSIKGLTLDLC
jgi:hypothetical protein